MLTALTGSCSCARAERVIHEGDIAGVVVAAPWRIHQTAAVNGPLDHETGLVEGLSARSATCELCGDREL